MTSLRKNIGILYIFLLAMQVVLITQYFANSLPIPRPDYFYFESVALYFNDHKRVELIGYIIGVIILGLFFMGILLGEKKLNLKTKRYALYTLLSLTKKRNKGLLFLAILLFILLPISIFYIKKIYIIQLILQSLNLILSVLFPFWNYFLKKNQKITQSINQLNDYFETYLKFNKGLYKKYFYISLLSIGFLQLGYLFYDPIINKPKIINEYFNVPEQTILANGKKIENKEYFEILRLQQSNPDDLFTLDKKTTHDEEKEWIESNKFETNWQVLSRFMIHHNAFMFIPISEFSLDKNVNTINAQYGLGSAWAFEKLLSITNYLSIDGWLKLSYLFYYLYFSLFIAIAFLITRSLSWTTMIFLLSLAAINIRGYDFLLLPPGESPWRHIFDILIVYLLYLYVEKKSFIYYLLVLLFSFFSIVLNPQIGVMIFMAVIVSSLFFAYREKSNILWTTLCTVIAIILSISIFTLSSSANDIARYYIDGVIGFPISFRQMFVLFIMIILGYVLLYKILKDTLTTNYLYLVFLLIYTQELVLYIVWHYDINGFKSRAFIYIITVAFLLFPLRRIIAEHIKNYLLIGISAFVGIIYIMSIVSVLKSKYEYEKIFVHHVTYEWNMDRAHIVSTMNPIYFQNGVDLIQKYSKGQDGIYIISEYDNFLPFLAHKYSLMPFFDLKWYLITPKELNKSIKLLQENKPEHIFVDTGIDRNLNNEIIDPKFPEIGNLYAESVWRIQRLKLLNNIFQDVSDDYELVEQGYLISVYKRKDSNEAH